MLQKTAATKLLHSLIGKGNAAVYGETAAATDYCSSCSSLWGGAVDLALETGKRSSQTGRINCCNAVTGRAKKLLQLLIVK